MFLPFANLQLKHWNPGATAPLILPVHVICNTSDEDLHANIRVNSRRPGAWVRQEEAHTGIAVLCGSGPSLADDLEVIRTHRNDGHVIFAMNGAAKFLHERGITADYQVMIDPRPITAELVGPAKAHLFASQVHPDCFERQPDAKVWHLQIENIDDSLPPYDDDYCLLGGAASVGNTATCLAYAMGFRTLHIYGYDSSHRDGAGHAFHQAINDGDPCARVLFNNREYVASLTMKLQAERFMETGRALLDAGCAVHVHGSGLLPDMWNTPPEVLTEREKYKRMWSIPAYRVQSPGEDAAGVCLEVMKPSGVILDFGCGTGRGALALAKAGLEVVMLDFADNCRDREALGLPFIEHDLAEPTPLRAPYGYCVDVMEHIPPEMVEQVVGNIMTAAGTVFFQISTAHDRMGAAINQRLHLTVEPAAWWRALFERMGYRVAWSWSDEWAARFVVSTTRN